MVNSILQAKPEDVEGIYQVRKITWLDTYPKKDFGITKKDIEEKFIEYVLPQAINPIF